MVRVMWFSDWVIFCWLSCFGCCGWFGVCLILKLVLKVLECEWGRLVCLYYIYLIRLLLFRFFMICVMGNCVGVNWWGLVRKNWMFLSILCWLVCLLMLMFFGVWWWLIVKCFGDCLSRCRMWRRKLLWLIVCLGWVWVLRWLVGFMVWFIRRWCFVVKFLVCWSVRVVILCWMRNRIWSCGGNGRLWLVVGMLILKMKFLFLMLLWIWLKVCCCFCWWFGFWLRVGLIRDWVELWLWMILYYVVVLLYLWICLMLFWKILCLSLVLVC